jgi:hypothetical protein
LRRTALLLTSFVVMSGSAVSQAPQPSQVARTQVASPIPRSIQELRDIAANLSLDSVLASRFNPPRFFIGDGIFSFYPGDPPVLGDDLVGPRQHPFLIPLARTLQVEDLRRFISQQPNSDYMLWVPYFDEAQSIIERKSLPLLSEPGRNPDELQQALFTVDGEVVAKLVEGAKRFATVHQLTYRRANIMVPAAHRISVSFRVNPPGARISVIPSTFYTPDDKFPYMWVEVGANDQPSLGGTYYYKASWPNGASTGPHQIRVEAAGQLITITPD